MKVMLLNLQGIEKICPTSSIELQSTKRCQESRKYQVIYQIFNELLSTKRS